MIIYGASGHGKVVADTASELGKKVVAFFDDNPDLQSFLECPVINHYDPDKYNGHGLIIAIGDNQIRKKIANIVKHNLETIISADAKISSSVQIEKGTVVFHGAVIQYDTKIGKNVIVNTAVAVDHDCKINDFVHLAPSSTLCGGVEIKEGVMIGAGATIIQGVTIGEWSVIGAGAVVVDDVPPYALYVGCPAKFIKKLKQ